jgi:hypothetical protein
LGDAKANKSLYLPFLATLKPMNVDLTTLALSLQQSQVQSKASMLMLKKQHQMDMMLVEMIDSVSRSAPLPTGQGTRVDKSA